LSQGGGTPDPPWVGPCLHSQYFKKNPGSGGKKGQDPTVLVAFAERGGRL